MILFLFHQANQLFIINLRQGTPTKRPTVSGRWPGGTAKWALPLHGGTADKDQLLLNWMVESVWAEFARLLLNASSHVLVACSHWTWTQKMHTARNMNWFSIRRALTANFDATVALQCDRERLNVVLWMNRKLCMLHISNVTASNLLTRYLSIDEVQTILQTQIVAGHVIEKWKDTTGHSQS